MDELDGADVDAARRLADDEHVGIALHLAGEHDLLLVAAGEIGGLQPRVGRADVELLHLRRAASATIASTVEEAARARSADRRDSRGWSSPTPRRASRARMRWRSSGTWARPRLAQRARDRARWRPIGLAVEHDRAGRRPARCRRSPRAARTGRCRRRRRCRRSRRRGPSKDTSSTRAHAASRRRHGQVPRPRAAAAPGVAGAFSTRSSTRRPTISSASSSRRGLRGLDASPPSRRGASPRPRR